MIELNDLGSLFLVMTVISFLTIAAMAFGGARVVAQLPVDYFSNREHHVSHIYLQRFHPFVRPVILVVKNLLGVLLALAGIAMLLLPGQGLLTLLAGIVLLDFPGKFALACWLVRFKQVGKSLNWLRKRAGEAPLEL